MSLSSLSRVLALALVLPRAEAWAPQQRSPARSPARRGRSPVSPGRAGSQPSMPRGLRADAEAESEAAASDSAAETSAPAPAPAPVTARLDDPTLSAEAREVLAALATVEDPDLEKDLVELGERRLQHSLCHRMCACVC